MKKQKTRRLRRSLKGGGCGSSKMPCKSESTPKEDLNQSRRGPNSKIPKFYTSTNNYATIMEMIKEKEKTKNREKSIEVKPYEVKVKPYDTSFPVNSINSIGNRKTIRRSYRL